MRRVIAGNWKMHQGPAATQAFFRKFLPGYQAAPDRVVLFFPPAVSLAAARDAMRAREDIELGVQNVHWEIEGAFTGEISAEMAAEAGARFVLVGHSERRHVFGETDDDTRRKVAAVLRAGLLPMLCVGETIEQRRAGRVDEVILGQLEAATASLSREELGLLALAYEPVWAIGTGETATPEDASVAHAALRRWLAERGAEEVPILYGGSVKPENAAQLLSAPEVDGVLVGGASLDPEGFAAIASS